MSVLGRVDGTGQNALKLRRILYEWSGGEGWGQARRSELLDAWDGDADDFEDALQTLEDDGEVELVEVGDVVSVQPADGAGQNQEVSDLFGRRLVQQRSR